MNTPSKSSVFISYARKDGAQLAQRLQRDLSAHGLSAWLDTQRLVVGATWTTEIERAIDKSGVLLALMTPGSYVSEICRAEQLRSLRRGKRVVPLLAQPGSEVPLHLEAKQYRDFTGAKPYAGEFKLLLEDLRFGRNALALRGEFRTTYVTAPPLPRNYVERSDALARLRNAVVTDGSGPSIALTALEGMGGIGKTILAQALSHDEVVQQAFPDGVIWSTTGKDPAYDLVTRMQEVRRALGDEPVDKESELQCINRYRTAMRDKAALIVVDDVWRSRDVEPFRAESLRSRLLFTTRDASIAAAVGAEEHIADLLTVGQSRDLLARWCGSKPEDLPPEAGDLIQECGRLPLALGMIGAMLRGKPPAYWKHEGNLLRSADLAKITAQFPDYPHTDLLRAIQVSVDALDAKARERYFGLAVLLEDMPIHPAIQQTLWGVDEGEALETAAQFVGLSLAQLDRPPRDGDTPSIRLHDLQLDYVRAQYSESDREALETVRAAVRLSSHVIERDPQQFASQMLGRLLSDHSPRVQKLMRLAAEYRATPWLKPLAASLTAPGGPLMRVLAGHSSRVNAVAVTPDGKRAVSASLDHTLKVWDLEAGNELQTLAGHCRAVNAVAVTADGKRAVSASDDETLKVWDLETGNELQTLAGHSRPVNGVAVTADGKRAVSASDDQTMKVWDLESGKELQTLSRHKYGVNGVAVTADGKRAVSASRDRTLKVWDLESGKELKTLAGHRNEVLGVAVTPGGNHAVSASWDKTLKVWDLASGKELQTLTGHSLGVTAVTVTPDGKRAVSASVDQTLKVWDLASGRELQTLAGHSVWVHAVTVTADGKRAVSGSLDQTLNLWDLVRGKDLQTLAGHSDLVAAVAVTQDGKRAVSGSLDQTLKVWDLARGKELQTLAGHRSGVTAVAATRDGKRAVSGSRDRTLKVWDLASGKELQTLVGHSKGVTAVAVAPDGKYVISASHDQTLKVWDLARGKELQTLAGHSEGVNAVAVTPDGRYVVSASYDQTLKVWDLASGKELQTLAGHIEGVNAVAVTPDGKCAVSASGDETLKVWDLETGNEVQTLAGHRGWVTTVAVTPDGKCAVSASDDHTLKVWDLETGKVDAAFTADASLRSCAVGPDGRVIVAGDASGRVHFLSLELKQES
jgi:WD40 repeat protein